MSSLTGECAAQKLKNVCSSSIWTWLHHMDILGSQNKITDFFMILAWACPFKQILVIFTQLKLWIAVARHNFKWVNIFFYLTL